ncbi:MAG: SDR family oxidoreductase [Bacteroidetes bacterium]|nr:SDR family oxidoreductase [Bacteroidota bacterium]
MSKKNGAICTQINKKINNNSEICEILKHYSLKGKVIIITGGYGYFGVSICKELLKFGAIVYLTGRNKTKLNKIKKKFNTVDTIKYEHLDISNSVSIKKTLAKINKSENKIDILINNAVFGKTGSFDSQDQTAFLKSINGTLGGVYEMSKNCFPYLKENRNIGTIINIASMYGVVVPNENNYNHNNQKSSPGYVAGKSAIIQLTKHMASAWGIYGIRVNTVSPGPFPNISGSSKNSLFIEKLKSNIPLGRVGEPVTDLCGLIIFLCSNASKFITGQNFIVDGGWTIL